MTATVRPKAGAAGVSQTNVRVDALVARMTLDQKIGQMTQPERIHVSPAEVKAFHIGSVLSGGGSCPGRSRPADWVAMNDAYWAASMEEDEDHLAIPLLYGVDAIHGNGNVRGATIFPHNIGLGAMRDPDLIERIGRVTSREVLAAGVEWTFAPTLAVSRDARWGRTYESYSEDPRIVAGYASRIVRGLQDGRMGVGPNGVVACAKHWVGDGGTEAGVDQGDTVVGEEDLRRLHIAPYRPALEAGVLTVMVSLSSWKGAKCHAHRYLIQDVLKGEMGFGGFVVSDWNGIDPLADDYSKAAAMAANAGIDMFMVPETWKSFISGLRTQVERGAVPIERIDDAVGRILRVKSAIGLFDRPRPWARRASNDVEFGSAEHREVAREAVRKSLVLLKNRRGILPLQRDARILVTGRNAHDRGRQCGGFTVEWQGVSGNDAIEGGTSIWEGIREVAPRAVLCEKGGADATREHFDAAIVVIGEKPYAEGLGDIREPAPVRAGAIQPAAGPGVLEPYGDTLELATLHPEDLGTIRALAARDIPVVTVLISGRPLVVNAELSESSAFVAAWLPGSEGAGVADVLFGDCEFHGRLPVSWPADMPGDGDSRSNGTRGTRARALFPLGYGLRMGSLRRC
ncbi:MAG: endoglucanase [Gemmatimonadetes bacterium]|nr:glycoside hydrolase family 3 C-terminal domain-containing protein [Gemmatimonadota bacterium]MYA40347.1 endoglucanase [Gemmatimonadota bacterium]MYJ09161.1 endoglucanase [Gemmatimonadota bacterium]